MMASTASAYKFEDFVLLPGEHLLRRRDAQIPLRPKAFQALVYLVERQGRLVKKDELLDSLWPGVIVTENALSRCITELRQALGDSAQAPVFIETIPRLGFKFIAAVERIPYASPASGVSEEAGLAAQRLSRKPVSRSRWLFITAVLMAAAAIVYAGWLSQRSNAPQVFPSIAVLPFTDMSENQDQEYFCNGMTEELITRLSRIPVLKVIARTSVMRYKNSGKSIKKIGEELQVATILEGSIRKEGDEIRVTAQLIDVVDESHLWAQSFNKKLANIFDLQDEVSQAIAQALHGRLTSATISALASAPPKNTEAYEYYLKGRYQLYNKFAHSGQMSDFQNALGMFHRAIAIDSNYALAYVGLADAFHSQWVYSGFISEEALDLKLENATIAVKLNPTSAEAHNMVASAYLTRGELDKAYPSLDRALKLNPNLADANYTASFFMKMSGLLHQSVNYFYRTLELDPFSLRVYGLCAERLMQLGKLEEAATQLKRGAEIDPDFVNYNLGQANLAILLQDYEQADTLLAKAEKIAPQIAVAYRAFFLAAKGDREKALTLSQAPEIYTLLGLKGEAIDVLKQGAGSHTNLYLYLTNSPIFANLRDEPRFIALVEQEKEEYEENLQKYGELGLE